MEEALLIVLVILLLGLAVSLAPGQNTEQKMKHTAWVCIVIVLTGAVGVLVAQPIIYFLK